MLITGEGLPEHVIRQAETGLIAEGAGEGVGVIERVEAKQARVDETLSGPPKSKEPAPYVTVRVQPKEKCAREDSNL